MGLSKSINGDTEYIEKRDNLYWNKYKYKSIVDLLGVYMYRYFNFPVDVNNVPSYTWKRHQNFKDQILNNFIVFNNLFPIIKENAKNKKISVRIEGNRLCVFSNDLTFLNDLKTLHNDIKIVEAKAIEKIGIKYFVREPKHKFRVYMKSKRVTQESKTELIQFITKNKKLFPSKALKKWVLNDKSPRPYWSRSWMSSAWYVDFDEDSYLSYLHLMFNDTFGKSYTLEKRPEP